MMAAKAEGGGQTVLASWSSVDPSSSPPTLIATPINMSYIPIGNPFDRQLKGTNLRLKRAQLALLKRPNGQDEQKAFHIAQQAFCKAWQLSTFGTPPVIPEHATGIDTTRALDNKRARNRVSANKYRKKKRAYIQDLEQKVKTLERELKQMHIAMAQLRSENAALKSNVAMLRQLLSEDINGSKPVVDG